MTSANDATGARKGRSRLTAAERRAQIIRSARATFGRMGLAGARTRDLAADAGVSEAVLYRHFASKENLFEVAVAQPLEDAVRTLVESAGSPPDFSPNADLQREQTSNFIYDLCVVMDEVASLLGVVVFGESATAERYYVERIQPTLDTIADVLRANYDAWPHRPFDPDTVVHLLFGMVWFTLVGDKLAGRERDLHAFTDQVTSIFMDGLLLSPAVGDGVSAVPAATRGKRKRPNS